MKIKLKWPWVSRKRFELLEMRFIDLTKKYDHANNCLTFYQSKELSREQIRQKAKQMNIGQNDPCPCGSGNKFKKCCGK